VGYLDANPVQYVERPRGEDKEMDVLTPEEVRRLLEAQEEPLRTLLLTAILTGMRQGELFGLQWEDIDAPGSRAAVALARYARHAQVQALAARDRYAADARARPKAVVDHTEV